MNDHTSGLSNATQTALAVLAFITSGQSAQVAIVKALKNILYAKFDEVVLNQEFETPDICPKLSLHQENKPKTNDNDIEPTIIPFCSKKINNHPNKFPSETILLAPFQNNIQKDDLPQRFSAKDYTKKSIPKTTHLKLFEPELGSADSRVPVCSTTPAMSYYVDDDTTPRLKIFAE